MKQTSLIIAVIAAIFFLLPLAPARAANCTNPAGVEGEVIFDSANHVPEVCNGSTWSAMGALSPAAGGAGCSNPSDSEGTILYNSAYHVLQYCDGDTWRAASGAVHVSGCTAPTLCPNIGDVCDDGNAGDNPDPIFAGFIVYNDPNSADAGKCKALYVTNDNQSTSVQWETTTGTKEIATDSFQDGKINDSQVPNSSTLPAFKLCKDLTEGGYSDWYLPAMVELDVLFEDRAAINANAAGALTTGYYWSSTESGSNSAWYQHFGHGEWYDPAKTDSYVVRCVRRN